MSLADFLGSMITCAVASPRGDLRTVCFQLGRRICLASSQPTTFNRLFRQAAALSLLRLHIATRDSCGILTASSIGLAIRLILRSRLTPGRLALPGKPWSFGGGASPPPYRYLFLHLLFRTLQSGSRRAFDAERNAPLPSNIGSTASAGYFIPDYYPCPVPRLVSCYALFE